jgi:polar amino acid transport system permease protein
MLKTTSLVIVIAYFELMTSVQQIYAQNFRIAPLLIVAALWYLLLTSILTLVQTRIEKRFSRGSASPRTITWTARMLGFRFGSRNEGATR